MSDSVKVSSTYEQVLAVAGQEVDLGVMGLVGFDIQPIEGGGYVKAQGVTKGGDFTSAPLTLDYATDTVGINIFSSVDFKFKKVKLISGKVLIRARGAIDQ